jgi:spore germination cell wall hydrolase CwlJ-like protein
MVRCAFSLLRGRVDRFGRLALATAVVVATLSGPIPLALANAGTNVTEEIECLALTIYFEARGEPDEGKIAVGYVVMNRAQNPLFPAKICNVVRQGGIKRYRCQFTWWCDGRSDQPRDWSAWERSKALARSVFWEDSKDPTQGALWYHAESVVPSWRNKLSKGPKIGRHIFYREPESQRPAAKISSQ